MIFDKERKTIITERLHLRLFQRSDAQEVARICQNDNIYRNTLYIPRPYTIDCAYDWMARHEENYDTDRAYEFALIDRITGELIGAIALSNIARFQHGELGYWIAEEYWNQGFASEAGKAMLYFAFTIKNYHKVYARYFASNPASGKVMSKLGMRQEGILREQVKKDERFEDLICYGILKQEWSLDCLQIQRVEHHHMTSLYEYWQNVGKTVPYFFHVEFKQWINCLYDDERDGERIFKDTQEYVARLNDEIIGFIQFGIPTFHYTSKGDKLMVPNIGVIRHLYFNHGSEEVGHRLIQLAEEYFKQHDLHDIYAFYHAMGMSCNAHHGKLHQSLGHIESLLVEHRFNIEHENVYYRFALDSVLTNRNDHNVNVIEIKQPNESKCYYKLMLNDTEIGGAEVTFLKYACVVYLNWIWLKDECRGTGMGSNFMSLLIAMFAKEGYEFMDTDTAHDNLIAQAFYERNGFQHHGDSRSYVRTK